MDSAGVEFVGCSCGQHGPYTFYKAFKYFKDKKPKILSLGEFFFVEILRGAPVSVGELQLLWHDKNTNQLLTSVRLYFLPEHTPEGKQDFHGEDEILSLSEKLVLRLEDLVTLITEDVVWQNGLQAFSDEDSFTDTTHNEEIIQAFRGNNSGLQLGDVQKEKEIIGCDELNNNYQEIVIISYPQYCRYRSIVKRLETVSDKWLRNAIVSAIGGFTSKTRNCRILFCRDTFYHPELEDFELRMDHLAPNLKGRPRKKKSSLKRECSQEESDSYEEGSDTSSLASISQASASNISTRPRRRSSQNGFSWEKGHRKVSKEEQGFMVSLQKFMKERQTPIDRVPSLGFKQIDLYYFYTLAKKLGGYDMITEKKLWKHLYDKLGGHPGSTSAATCTRRHYERLLLAYERYERGHENRNRVKARVKSMITSQQAKVKDRDRHKSKSSLEEKKELLTQALDVSVEEKVRRWNAIRKQKQVEREHVNCQMRKVPVRQTVKKMLDRVPSKEIPVFDSPEESANADSQVPNKASTDSKVVNEAKPPSPARSKLDVPMVKKYSRPSILSPLIQKKVQNHVKSSQSQEQTSNLPQLTSASQKQTTILPSQTPPAVISTQTLFYASNFPLPASHFIAHPTTSVDVCSRASDKSHPPFPNSSLFATDRVSPVNENQMMNAIPSMRPSVIQPTPKLKVENSFQYAGAVKSSTPIHNAYSSKPGQIPGHVNSIPAHTNHFKRSYPYSEPLPQKTQSLSKLPHENVDGATVFVNPVLANDPFFNTVKRMRSDSVPSHPFPAHGSQVSKSTDVKDDDQPVDFSMKTMRQRETKETEKRAYESQSPAPKTFKCALFPQEFPTSSSRSSVKDTHDRPGSRSDIRVPAVGGSTSVPHYQEGHRLSPSSGSRSLTSIPLNNNNKVSLKPVTGSAAYTEIVSPNLHPAFPAPYMPPQISPNNVVPLPVHLQHLYAAQYANIQMAAYEDLMRQQVLTQVGTSSPVLISPTQLYQNVYKESQKFSASKS